MNTYLIVSETIYHTNSKLKELTSNVSNIVTFNLDINTIDEVLQEASYFSMFDENKCIIVKNAKIFGANKNGESGRFKEDSEKLLKYLNNENRNTKLIFLYNGKCDSKKKIYNLIKDSNNLFAFNSMSKTDMKNELLKIVTENKYTIEDKSLWHIINSTLGNFDLCTNELHKIFLYYNKPTAILHDDVINLVINVLSENSFKLVDSIINKNLEESLKLLNDAKTLKIDPNNILSLIIREFRLMIQVFLYEQNKYSYYDILKEVNLQEWQLKKVKNNLNNYTFNEIKEEIVKLSNLDYKMKSGLINKDVLLINYVLDLCG